MAERAKKERRRSILVKNKFSHIYIEEQALKHPNTSVITGRFKDTKKIIIEDYREVFHRARQSFKLQKQAPKLILAVKKDNFHYKGPDICQNFGYTDFYYSSVVLNCLYNCEYCFLQGMYPSANIVVFVNIEDFFDHIKPLAGRNPVYLCVSYDTDLLSMEKIIPYASQWIEFSNSCPNLLIEIRTKSANYKLIKHIPPSRNTILAWSISPDQVIQKYEKGAPSLVSRLNSASDAANDGWQVRLSFEPVMLLENWQHIYKELIHKVFDLIHPSKILDINIDIFRMNRSYFNKIRKTGAASEAFSYPTECRNGIVSYPDAVSNELKTFLFRQAAQFYPENKIFIN